MKLATTFHLYENSLANAVELARRPHPANLTLVSMRQMLEALAYSIPENAYQYLNDSSLVEGYFFTSDNVPRQFYRNLKFLEISEYSLFDLVTNSPFALFDRDAKINEQSNILIQKSLAERQVVKMDSVPEFLLYEVHSPNKRVNRVQFRWSIPVINIENIVVGAIIVTDAKSANIPCSKMRKLKNLPPVLASELDKGITLPEKTCTHK